VGGPLSAQLPIDRRLALADGTDLPARVHGAALFADLAGFTALTEALARQLGPRLGAEVLTRHLNAVYDVVVGRVHDHGGSIVDFSGDAVTCWFDDANPPGAAVELPDASRLTLSMKVSVAAGPALRTAVGDPALRVVDILAGATISRTAAGERHAGPGEVVVDRAVVDSLADGAEIDGWRGPDDQPVAVLAALHELSDPAPWDEPDDDPDTVAPWVLHTLRDRREELDTELRATVAVFVGFQELDFDADADAPVTLDAYVRWVTGVVARHGGSLIQVTIGDKGSYLYVAFGAPIAHEDLADRAVACAVELRQPPVAVGPIEPPAIGMAQGVSRTGSYGGTARSTYGVLGDATNIAARLMSLAQPGEILAGSHVARDCRRRVGTEKLPAVTVKGHRQPVEIVRVLDGGSGAAEGRHFGRLVGRDAELAALVGALAATRRGERGTTVVIEAEPGVGKSHLVDAARQSFDPGNQVTWLTIAADDTQRASLHAVLPLLRDLFYLDLADSPETARQLFELRLADLVESLTEEAGGGRGEPDQPQRVGADVTDAAEHRRGVAAQLEAESSFLGALLGLHWEGSAYERHDPAARFDRGLAAVADVLRAESLRRPVVVHVRDAHWLDDDSRRVVDELCLAAAESPLCVVVDRRPPSAAEGTDLDPRIPTIRIDLAPLGPTGVAQLAAGVLDGPAEASLVEHLVARTAGNALFVEQLLFDLRDGGHLTIDDSGTWSIGAGLPAGLPSTLAAVLVSRLDRLEPALRRLVQAAAVLGERVDLAVLARMLDPSAADPSAANTAALAELVDAGVSAGVWHHLEGGAIAFRHALQRQAAYEMQLDATLRVQHRRAAAALRAEAAAADPRSELDAAHTVTLAHHEERGGAPWRAAAHLRQAARVAVGANAYREARVQLERALALTASLGASTRTTSRLHDRLGDAAFSTGSYETCVEHLRLALTVDPSLSARRATALWIRLGEAFDRWGRDDEAEAAFEAALERLQESPELSAASRIYAGMAMLHGRADAPDDLAAGVDLAEMALTFAGTDRALAARAHQCLCVLELRRDRLDDARGHGERSRELWGALGDDQGLAAAENNLGMVAEAAGDIDGAVAHFRAASERFEGVGNEHGLACTLDNLAQALVRSGDDAAGMACLERAVEILSRIGMTNEGVVSAMWRAGSW
jgi:class 3 adenylate cyclase/tetratricopeptide (TPR) repeat protein